MLGRLFAPLENLVFACPRGVLLLAAALAGLSVWLGLGIEVHTSTRDMVPENEPAQARWDALRSDFRDPEPLMVMIEGAASDEDLRAAADAAAAALATVPGVKNVYHRLDVPWIVDHAMWLAPAATVRQLLDALEEIIGDGRLEIGGIAALSHRLAERFERGLAESAAPPSAASGEPLERLTALLRQQRQLLENPDIFASQLPQDVDELLLSLAAPDGLDRAGYLRTVDGAYMVLVTGEAAERDRAGDLRFVSAARVAVSQALASDTRFTASFTGAPALTADEVAAVGRDSRITSAIAIVGVALLASVAFHRRRHAILGLLTLTAGVLWSIGALRLELGYLSVITTALVPILVGIGIDYAVHPLSQYELERRHGRGGEDAVRAAFRKTVAAVVVSAVTTAVAFFSLLLMDFRGYSELGLVAGVGVLLCLAASLLVLPALLLRFGAAVGGTPRRAPAVDRLWTDRLAAAVCARPLPVVLLAVVVTIAAAIAAPGVSLRTGLVDLLPTSSESLRGLEMVNRDPNFAPYFNMIAADDAGALRRRAARAANEPTIARFDSVLRFLPQDASATGESLPVLEALLDRVDTTPVAWPGAAVTAPALSRLEAALATAADAAFVTGRGELAANLELARREAEAALVPLAAATPEREAAWAAADTALQRQVAAALERLRGIVLVPPPGLEDVPQGIRDRLVTRSGRLLGYLIPAGDVFDAEFLRAFNLASRRVDNSAAGFPQVFEAHSLLITSGFARALLVGGVLVLIILIIDLRRPHMALLAALPVAMGTTWLLGLMVVLDVSFNLANLIAVPLVIGVGIDNGVHIIHRYHLERRLGVPTVLVHTGRAILIASLTTMVGFGSLALASHRGMAGLGILLFLGVGACMLASLVVLPNVLVLAERIRHRRAGAR